MFVASVFAVFSLTIMFVFITIRIFIYTGILNWNLPKFQFKPLLSLSVFFVLTGTLISIIMSHVVLKSIRQVISAANKLSDGDFNTRINLKGPYELDQLSKSFNHMAEELGNTEVLRSDFINNFSHEFKTPIVSMRGFAKILKYEELTLEEHDEYLDIIISESERLSTLATNVLNLSKIENQGIISKLEPFNISEQIRRTIVILEKKWNCKNLNFDFDCDEIYMNGNEELLSEVWINLLDNAIKFAEKSTTISIDLIRDEFHVTCNITNCGTGMDDETKKRIFDKFYQGDTSHTSVGNGLGLTIAKRIVELHNGSICVSKSDSIGSTFQVILPML